MEDNFMDQKLFSSVVSFKIIAWNMNDETNRIWLFECTVGEAVLVHLRLCIYFGIVVHVNGSHITDWVDQNTEKRKIYFAIRKTKNFDSFTA